MDLLLIVLLTLLNGVFAMSEMALASSRKARLSAFEEAGDRGAIVALRLMEQPTQFLSTVQIGITSIGVLNGIVGEAAFSDSLSRWLQVQGLSVSAAGILATAVVVSLITCITIVFGELVPKRIGQLYPETVARWVAPTMHVLAQVARPLVVSLSWATAAVLQLIRVNTRHAHTVTEEEIRASLSEGVDAGVIEKQEHQMVKNVFHLDDRPLTSIMVPRSEVVWLDQTLTVREALAQVAAHASHSWYPVCRGSLDDVAGVVSLGQMVHHLTPDDAIETLMVTAAFVPETLSGLDLLEQFRRPDAHQAARTGASGRMVLVVDEYGVVQGLMTPRDLLEAITGEWLAATRHDAAWATPRDDGSWLLDGTMPITEFKSRLDIRDDLPEEERGRYNTLAGLILFLLGHLPQRGERVECQGWQLEVQTLEGRRIDQVLARPIPIAPA